MDSFKSSLSPEVLGNTSQEVIPVEASKSTTLAINLSSYLNFLHFGSQTGSDLVYSSIKKLSKIYLSIVSAKEIRVKKEEKIV